MPRFASKALSSLLAVVLVAGLICITGPDVIPSAAAPQESASTAEQTPGETGTGDQALVDSEKKARKAASKAVKAQESAKAADKKKDDKSDGEDADDEKTPAQKKKEKAAKEKKAREEAARQRQVSRAVAYLNTLEAQLETATEDLSQIRTERKREQTRAREAKKGVEQAKYALDHAKRSLNTTVKEIYENGSLSYLTVLFGANNFDDFASRLYLLETIASKREQEVTQSRGLKETYEAKLAQYEQTLAKVKQLEAEAEDRSETINDSIDSQLELIGRLDPEMLSAVNDYDSVKATRKWLAKYGGSKSKKGSHPEIVNIASKYLGVPYVWGGETPSGFDCSGLVMYCYAKIGIELPHFARSQYDCGKHIAREALMPGDLVFFGPDVEGIHHVGIYVGANKYLQAPRTGDVVKVSSLADRDDYVGACRPGA